MKKIIIIIIFLLLIGLVWFYKNKQVDVLQVDIPPAKDYQEFVIEREIAVEESTTTDALSEEVVVIEEDNNKAPDDEELSLIDSINLDVPFTSQAPTANWDEPFQNACEEASLLMVDYYYQNKDLPEAATVESLLSNMVIWQQDEWQGHFNLTIGELAEFVALNTDYDFEIIEDLTIDKIKYYLNQGQPLIVPADGKTLANPFFRNGGPEYHMLVIKGYADDPLRPGDSAASKIITNDPGTSRGADFIYTYDNIIDSIADWNKNESLATGPKRALILYKD